MDNVIELMRDQNDETLKGEQLIEKIQIDKSPLWIIGNKEKGYMLAIGNRRLTEWMPTAQDVEIYLENNLWEMITIIVATMIETIDEIKSKQPLPEQLINENNNY